MGDRIGRLVERNRSVREGRFLYEDEEWFRRRYTEGASFRQLAAEANCSLRTIARWSTIHEVEARPAARPKKGRSPRKFYCECGNGRVAAAKMCMPCRNDKYRGQGNPNFRGLVDIMVLLRQHIATTWRPAVMARDWYRCQQCGDSRGGNLNAHHKIALSVLVKQKRDTWNPGLGDSADRLAFFFKLAEDPDVMDLSNGVTLCEKCHRDTHRGSGTYAYAGATGRRKAT